MTKKSTRYCEPELVALLKSNNKVAFEYLYYHYAPALYGIICKIVKDENTADDVMQDSFIKIWKNIAHYNPEKGTLFTWVLNVARHTAIDKRREDYKYATTIKWDVVQEADLSAGSIFTPLPATVDLKSIVERLLPEKKQLIQMVYFEGYTHQEASQHLGLPLGTVKSRVRKALQELRQTFEVSGTHAQFARN
ncbi:ECF RNA polymerase sigma factor RpoE [Dyadobacter sp. CECT 9623]|uniref:ECF RNA polymerase sigma factor RpoE n=1 Tax=Dyadobacter linearis TaxID=2823330 RepID=A0ABM8UYX1_9BACT|nr:sigma-70 family RNA polymerase sigma factor [Dyadobacter sp. CECT 9623]CAG5075043.1 ECF RNA polymerase sigma factor RpoE [Dyadobacter sp. CECT 9623]